MRLPFINIITVLLAVSFLAACKKSKEGPVPINFTLKGRLLKDCSGIPVANERLNILSRQFAVISNGYGRKEIGSGSTDIEGYFSIICARFERGGIIYLKQSWADSNTGGIDVEARAGDVIDIGDVYEHYTAASVLQFNFAQSHTDTLFVANWDATDTFFVYPAAGTQYVRLSRSYVGKPVQNYFAYYGFGSAGLKQPAQGVGGVNIRAEHAFEICGPGDTTVVNIP